MISEQIKTLYEIEKLSLQDIAEQLDTPLDTVKIALLQYSPKFREDIKTDKTKDFTDDELEVAKQAISRLMYAEDDNIAFKAAKFIFQERKGRNDPRTLIKNVNLNVTLINTQMQKAREAKQRAVKEEIEVKNLLIPQAVA